MYNILRFLNNCIILFLLILPSALAKSTSQQIDQMIKSKGDINYGLIIVDAETGKTIEAINANRVFVPASLTKIVTTYYALESLGEDYKYKTSIFAKSLKVKEQSLESPLYIKFAGDPSFTDEDLYNLLSVVKKHGVKKINANIIVDDSLFDNNWTSPGGFAWDDQPFCMAAPKSALIINQNCSEAFQTPSHINQKSPIDVLQPYVLSIKNAVKTVKSDELGCRYKSKYVGQNKYFVFGCIPDDSKKIRLNFALPDNRRMIKDYIIHWLKQQSIEFGGKVKFGKASGKIIASHLSEPLKVLTKKVLDDSNNLYSGAIFKTVTAKFAKGPAEDEIGADLLRKFLKHNGFNPKYMKIYGGSGESKYNLMSPSELSKILFKIYKSNKLRSIFLENLPSHAKTGTLKYRRPIKGLSDKLFIKTGTMTKMPTSGLGGYYIGKNNKYIIVMMMNNHNLTYVDAKALEDDILELSLKKLTNK